MENQAYYIQSLLANELDRYKRKENILVDSYIKEIQNVYQNTQQDIGQVMIVDKEKQREDRV